MRARSVIEISLSNTASYASYTSPIRKNSLLSHRLSYSGDVSLAEAWRPQIHLRNHHFAPFTSERLTLYFRCSTPSTHVEAATTEVKQLANPPSRRHESSPFESLTRGKEKLSILILLKMISFWLFFTSSFHARPCRDEHQ